MSDDLTLLADGRKVTTEELVPIVYADLRRLASSFFRREAVGRTLQPTALVHEAYVRLADQKAEGWENRAQFLAVAAQAMRRVLVDAARARSRSKRGGGLNRVTLMDDGPGGTPLDADVLDLDAALQEMAGINERHVQIVQLRFFGGLTLDEVAQIQGVSQRTIVKEWAKARAWLARFLERGKRE